MSLRAQRSNLPRETRGECFLVSLLAMTRLSKRFTQVSTRRFTEKGMDIAENDSGTGLCTLCVLGDDTVFCDLCLY